MYQSNSRVFAGGLSERPRLDESRGGREFFISIEGGHRGFGGGATQRALAGGQKATKKATDAYGPIPSGALCPFT